MIDFDSELHREWLETNGIGGFASATVPGVNTRRYHGLLTAALHPPVGRFLLLSKMEETVFLNGARYELSANLYPGAVNPHGYQYITGFRIDPFPIVTYEAGGVIIEKRVFMVHGENTTVIEYEVMTDAPCTIELRPLIAFRDYHCTTRANAELDPSLDVSDGQVSIEPYRGLPRLRFAHNANWVSHDHNWYYNFDYPRERERGLDSSEDLFQPMTLQFELAGRGTAVVIASLEPHTAGEVTALRRKEIERRAPFAADPLLAAADQFIVKRGENLHTIMAGYHWFSDWGRDAMIALPGLTLATGRFDIARDILLAFSAAVDRGMIPNRFPDAGETPEYNTADASLWYFEAIRQYTVYAGDTEFVLAHLYPTMKSIIDWHIRGTRYNIHCDTDGLISAGTPDTQLTWMDAKIGDFVATPRSGKPVEIQALWYNALMFTISLKPSDDLNALAQRASQTFNNLFWNEAAGCLYDVVDGDRSDSAIRPNQVIALSLGYIMVDRERGRRILEVVERDLLTPYGLRTLAPSDPHYCRQCDGDAVRRDSSYHQGTVWPWLLGPYITACKRFGYPTGPWFDKFKDHLNVAGIGTVSEILDGDPPYTPRGCIAQAWSVAEILRCKLTLP